MCGITGAIWSDPAKEIVQSVLDRMTDALTHRGPDDRGTSLQAAQADRPGIALGHRRLSIIDLAGGRQPMENEDGSLRVIFNGEIYNYVELQEGLRRMGHALRTKSDTETILHLYEDHGLDFVQKLNGMFAIALWDAARDRLVLARDRLGQKPLVYREEPGRFLFGSELKALLSVPGIPREIDPESLDAYLTYQYVPHPRTILQGFSKLPPGHLAVYEEGRLRVFPYWNPDFAAEEPLREKEASEELRELLTASVRRRLRSDVPLGAFLSGGVDSTVIVGLMQSLSSEPVRTFSIGFPEAEYDETRYAKEVSKRFGTIHQEFLVEPDAVEILDRLVWHYDEPFADSSAVPTWYVSQMTRRHVTVALSGDGGDELFTGYPRYKAAWLAQGFDRLPRFLRRLAAGSYWRSLPASPRQKSLRRRFKRFVDCLGKEPIARYLEWIAIFGEERRAGLYREDFAAELGDSRPVGFLRAAFARAAGRDPVTATSLADLVTYLPCDLMTKVDIASMAHGLECRQPFLDHTVVEAAIRLPGRLKFRLGSGKRLLKATFADLLPDSVRRRPKMGFGVPLDYWFRGPLNSTARDLLLDPQSFTARYFREETITALLDEHAAGKFDHGYRLWSLLFLERWCREWL